MILTLAVGGAVSVQAQVAPPPPKPECKEIVFRKWNDLLFVDNGDELFVSYQWYQNGVPLPGETKQYLYTEGVVLEGDGNFYYAVATRSDGGEVISCEGLFEDFSPSVAMSQQKAIRRAVAYSYTGEKVGEWNHRPEGASLHGCYLLVLTDEDGGSWSERALCK